MHNQIIFLAQFEINKHLLCFLFVPRLDATKCVKDIFDPQFPHKDASPEEFDNDTIISQECVITLCLLKVFFSFMKGSDKVREKYTIPS